jgi:virulence-associated protein VapD
MLKNIIYQTPHDALGYDFIKAPYIPRGKNEYYLRNLQNRNGIEYRRLTAQEIERLVINRNTSDNWNNFLVSDAFNPDLVKNCAFFGLVRIGKLEPVCLGFSDLKMPVGLYHSTIISCDFGDNVVVNNVNYLSHYIIGSEVMLINIHELVATNHAKFGNGIIKEGEDESVRIWMEICNENTGRKVMPFNGMLPGDAFLWSRYREDDQLQQQFKKITEESFNNKRGYYGKIGDRTLIKNCSIIKDVWIGSDAYIKGANKLKNLTINSGPEGLTQIGEGCELVNGIVGYGCRIFYGVKAVRFIMASHSQLKYGARLINSYLGNNATISCCEVLNSLIFPSHEQHHNNSFLCAALVMGQSNIAAGATIGSNHNSRGADGEIIMGRGFWPGLCVSLKHNSRFASFCIVTKGDYPAELDIPIPFSLVHHDVVNDRITILPGYWFLYNMYALARNAAKYQDRDQRTEKKQLLEFDYLAPDTAPELLHALQLIETATGKALLAADPSLPSSIDPSALGKQALLSNNEQIQSLTIHLEGIENSKRKVVLLKVLPAYQIFCEMLLWYGIRALVNVLQEKECKNIGQLKKAIPTKLTIEPFINVGGQLIKQQALDALLQKIKSGKVKSWNAIHDFYEQQGSVYANQKQINALAVLETLTGIRLANITGKQLNQLLTQAEQIQGSITNRIRQSRMKDYENEFRKMVYANEAEMKAVLGDPAQNAFLLQQQKESVQLKKTIQQIRKQFVLQPPKK